MKLNELKCKGLKPKEKPYKLSDGGGLYMEVMPNGSKYWRMQYRFLGKLKRIAFGVYPEVTLKEAREEREKAKKLLRLGKNPAEVRKQEKLSRIINYENNFEALAKEWHQARKHTWQPKHAENILKRLSRYVFPQIGARPIKDVTPPELLHLVRPISGHTSQKLAIAVAIVIYVKKIHLTILRRILSLFIFHTLILGSYGGIKFGLIQTVKFSLLLHFEALMYLHEKVIPLRRAA